jgi:hypothetical protein
MIGSFTAEIGGAYLVTQQESVSKCIVSFMGMVIIANIDNIMAETINNIDISADMKKNKVKYKKLSNSLISDWKELREWKE